MLATINTEETSRPSAGLESVDLVLDLLELLAGARHPMGVTEVARTLGLSKPRVHRHLRGLVARGYARQDRRTDGYELSPRLVTLGERVRERFDVIGAIRPTMPTVRDATGLAVTASALVDGEVVVMEVLQGQSIIEFAVRPGSKLALHASAHGLVSLAFGPPDLLDQALAAPLPQWTEHTLSDPQALAWEVAEVRRRGWATAVDAVQVGLNALAAPVFDHRHVCRGAVAVVGGTQVLPAVPSPEQIAAVTSAAAQASRSLGGKGF